MPNAGSAEKPNRTGGKPPVFFVVWLLATGLILFVLLDGTRPPAAQQLVRGTVWLIDRYKADISRPLAEDAGYRPCRFTPTCSMYAREALLRYGFIKGSALAVWRVLRCNPFYGDPPIEDPVPER